MKPPMARKKVGKVSGNVSLLRSINFRNKWCFTYLVYLIICPNHEENLLFREKLDSAKNGIQGSKTSRILSPVIRWLMTNMLEVIKLHCKSKGV